MKDLDKVFLKKTLTLASKARGLTHPNPMVGAVIVKNGKIISEGYHRKAGLPHAEIEALQAAKKDIYGATLYVNLEPCSHFGRTPPCTEAIIRSGIKRVVCATLDPNPKVNGRGLKLLSKAGIQTSVGLLSEEARRLNEIFFTFQEKKRPFIALKFAASLDGKIATRTFDSKWITNDKARVFARNLRSQYQAVLVGINTVLRDNPHLGVSVAGRPEPLRIILDPRLRIPLNSQVLRDKNVLIVTTNRAPKRRQEQLLAEGFELLTFMNEQIKLRSLMRELVQREITSIFVEGGAYTLGSFVDYGLVDKVYAFHAPMVIGGRNAVSAVEGRGVKTVKNALRLQDISWKKFEDNILTIGYV